jgi:cell division protein FtsB
MASTARRAATPRARRVSSGRGGRRPTATGPLAFGAGAISVRGIRWDRVARLSLLVALGLVLLLYISPAMKYFEAWRLSGDTHTELKDLRTDNARLRARARQLKSPSRVELEARRLGMARPGERVYVVRGLPR